MPNTELAARIHAEILAYPEHHDQRVYLDGVLFLAPGDSLTAGSLDCGTALCVAGYAAHFTGYSIEVCNPGLHEETIAHRRERSFPVADAARAELGLSMDDAKWLFHGIRTRDEVLTALAQFADGAPRIDKSVMPSD